MANKTYCPNCKWDYSKSGEACIIYNEYIGRGEPYARSNNKDGECPKYVEGEKAKKRKQLREG